MPAMLSLRRAPLPLRRRGDTGEMAGDAVPRRFLGDADPERGVPHPRPTSRLPVGVADAREVGRGVGLDGDALRWRMVGEGM